MEQDGHNLELQRDRWPGGLDQLHDLGPISGLAVGDIYTSGTGVSDVSHAVGRGMTSEDVFYYAAQRVEGLSSDAGQPLDATQLHESATYAETIGMTGFDVSRAADGVLPKLYGTDGELLPGQVDNKIDDATLHVTKIVAAQVGTQYNLQFDVEHPEGVTITGANFDWLTPAGGPKVSSSDSTHTAVLYEGIEPERAYDSYCMTAVNFKDSSGADKSQPLAVKVDFGSPVYKTISDISDWQRKVDPETYENYQITGDLDFSGLDEKSGNMGARIGRLDGVPRADGSVPVVKNIDVAVWGDDAWYLANGGVQSLADERMEGDYVNLWGGWALGTDGNVTRIANVGDGTYAPVSSKALASVGEARPLFSDEGWKTFWTYTSVSDGAAERDLRIYPCGNGEYAVSAELDTVADGFVFSDAGDEHYRTVLLASGKLEDLADPLCYPDGFKNEGIQSMSNTADATTTLAVVRYADGSATCFDYTTGEAKFQKQSSGEDQSLGEYAKDFFGGLFSSADDAAKTGDRGYASALKLENKAGRGGFASLDGASGDSGDAAVGGDSGDVGEAAATGSAAGGFASGGGCLSVYEPSKSGYVTYSKDDVLGSGSQAPTSINQKYGVGISSDGTSYATTTSAPAQTVGGGAVTTGGRVAIFTSAVLAIGAVLLML